MNAPDAAALNSSERFSGSRASPRDVVLETIDALASALALQGFRLDRGVRLAAELQVRAAWGGGRVYVAKSPSAGANRLAARDIEIALAAQSGVSVACLAERYGLSTRRIRQILGTRSLL